MSSITGFITCLICASALTLVAATSKGQTALDKKVTISIKDQSLENTFEQLAKVASVNISYGDNWALEDHLSISAKDEKLGAVLDRLLSNRPFSYVSIDDKIIIRFTPDKPKTEKVVPPSGVTGKVVDEQGQPLPGVTIRIKKTGQIAYTNENGDFRLNNLPDSATLVFSFIGFLTQEVKVTGTITTLNVSLKQDVAALKEVSVVSTGYQDIPQERATGSFSKLDNELFNRRPSTNILERLDGTVAGLAFSSNYNPTSPATGQFSIRGISTIFANAAPLIVVDNFPFDGDLYNLNPNDIESVTVLKDAAAASIWGTRSGNGVVVIKTKRGRLNQPLNIEFNANYTYTGKPDLSYDRSFIDASTFIDAEQFLFNKGYYDVTLNSTTTRPVVSPVVELLAQQRSGTITAAQATVQIDAFRNNDLRTDLSRYFYQSSLKQQYSLNLNGGSNKTTYYFSAGYDKIPSVLVGNRAERTTFSTGFNFNPIKQFEISSGLNFTTNNSTTDNPGVIQALGKSGYYPYARLADDDGNALALPKDYRQSYINTLGTSQLLDWNYKPIDELNIADKTTKNLYAKFNAGIKYTFITGLTIDLKYQLEKQNNSTRDNRAQASYYTRNYINLFTQVSGTTVARPVPLGGILYQSRNDLTGNSYRAQLNFNRSLSGKHDISFIGGIDAKELIENQNSWGVYGYNSSISTTSPVNYNVSYTKYANLASPGFIGYNDYLDRLTDEYFSYFGNASYTYDQRYIVSGSARIDQSNLFGVNTNQKSVPLWSAGLAWVLNKETFFNVGWLPYLKLRSTYGYNGNIDKTVSAFTTAWFRGTSNITNSPYVEILNPPNPELRWERIGVFNVGLDLATKNNVFTGSIEYYSKKGNDIIGYGPVDPTTGVAQFKGNVANIKGNGIDIELNYRTGSKLQWLSTILFSKNRDEVTNYNRQTILANYLQFGDGSTGVDLITPVVGKPVYSVFSYPWAGLDPLTGDPQGYVNGKVSKDYATIRGSSDINSAVYNGPARPPIFGSFRNTFSYKNLSLSFSMSYRLGYFFRKPTVNYNNFAASWTGNVDYNSRWQRTGDELITNVPSFVYPLNSLRDEFFQYASINVEKADNVRLQDIQFTYELPKALLGNAFKRVQVYAYGSNLGIVWKASKADIDPEFISNQYVNPKSIALGLRSTF